MPLLQTIPSLATNLIVLLTLGAIFVGSWMMFRALVQRSTDRRQRVSLMQWGKEHRLKMVEAPQNLPPPFEDISGPLPRISHFLTGRNTTLLQIEGNLGQERFISPMHGKGNWGSARWHVLARRLESSWPATGLRPSSAPQSVLDLFSLTSFPALGPTERFVVYGTDTTAAQWLSRSAARGLLPPDVGFLLHGSNLILDFSSRPFDEVEFNRMLALADQLVTHLQSIPSTRNKKA